MGHHKRLVVYAVAVFTYAALVASTVASCVPSTGQVASNNVESQPVVDVEFVIEGKPWVLVSFVGSDGQLTIPTELSPTLRFDNGSYEFDAGCNPVFGEYELENGVPRIKTVVMRSVDCTSETNGVEAMALENAVADSIDKWTGFVIVNDELRIGFEGNEVVFRHVPAGS